MDRSPRFGSAIRDFVALFRLAFATAPSHKDLTLPRTVTRQFIMQKARGQPFPSEDGHRPPTACKLMISGTISLPLKGYFSTFPHGTGSLSVTREYLALAGGPAGFL